MKYNGSRPGCKTLCVYQWDRICGRSMPEFGFPEALGALAANPRSERPMEGPGSHRPRRFRSKQRKIPTAAVRKGFPHCELWRGVRRESPSFAADRHRASAQLLRQLRLRPSAIGSNVHLTNIERGNAALTSSDKAPCMARTIHAGRILRKPADPGSANVGSFGCQTATTAMMV